MSLDRGNVSSRRGWALRRAAALGLVAATAVLVSHPAWLHGQAATQPTSSRFDVVELLSDLRVLAADDMQGREFGTDGGARARTFVLQRFRESGVQPFDGSYLQTVSAQIGRTGATRSGANVVGFIDGTARPRRYIVVSAHYDHIGVRNGVVYNGADDNASGTAALFAMASYFRAHRLASSILFVAFDGEEEGLLGSKTFVRTPPVPPDDLLIDVNADMIGRESRNRLFVVGIRTQPGLKPLIERVAARTTVDLLIGHDDPSAGRGEDWTRDSDQYSFMQAGIPALYFGVEDYEQHHQPTDDAATITEDFYVRAVEALIDVVKEFDADAPALERLRQH